jgi:short-subunit dehydrogenase
MTPFAERYGRWALVVGGSDGLGAAFADGLAARGLDLVLVARRQDVLADRARRLRDAHGVLVRTVVLDAAGTDAPARIAQHTDDLDVGLLVCNAARAPTGAFLDLAVDELDRVLALNCRLATRLAHHFGARMAERGRGGIVLLSSMAGAQGSAWIAQYAATKAYLRVLAEGLWAELAPCGVDVIACCPGRVRTPTLARGNPYPPSWLAPPVMAPEPVVCQTLNELGRRPVVIPGRLNRLAAFVTGRLLPRRSAVRLVSAATRRMYPTESHRPAPPGAAGG